jgi:hypothetical protein
MVSGMVPAATRTLLHALLVTDVELHKYRSPQAKAMNQYASALSKKKKIMHYPER